SSRDACAWPATDELLMLRQRLATAAHLIETGRHAPGERGLRQAIGALARRRDWTPAADGSLVLAGMLLRRGRLREGQAALGSAADFFSRGGDSARLVDVAIQRGVAFIELARLEDAESVLGAAISAADSSRDEGCRGRAAFALARTLFWRGKYDEAQSLIGSMRSEGTGGRLPVLARALASRIAVGQQALDLAVTWASEAVERARQIGEAPLVAEATYAAAFAHLAVGDVVAVERDADACVLAARVAHDPLLAARCRLLFVEALRRAGRQGSAMSLLSRIGKVASTALPPIVRARLDLLRD